MSIIFDGKKYAESKKVMLSAGVKFLKEKGIVPHLATIIIGNDKASQMYVILKKKYLESAGCLVDIYKIPENARIADIKLLIDSLNSDDDVDGIMIQLPLPKKMQMVKLQMINLIKPEKDVDGLREDSKFLHPTAKAVIEILTLALNETDKEVKTICIVGASGMVGKPLVKQLTLDGYKVISADEKTASLQKLTLQADLVISTAGVMNIISSKMVKKNAIVIDVGSPFGDIVSNVKEKTSFFTPVPGGVGPVTISCLLENLLTACQD